MRKKEFVIAMVFLSTFFFFSNVHAESIGYRCAVIDGRTATENATIVRKYNYLLEVVANKCNTTKVDIADAACAVQDRLKSGYGRDAEILNILEFTTVRVFLNLFS